MYTQLPEFSLQIIQSSLPEAKIGARIIVQLLWRIDWYLKTLLSTQDPARAGNFNPELVDLDPKCPGVS